MKKYEQLFIGLTEKDAIKLAKDSNLDYRTLELNGSQFFGDCQYDDQRISFYIKNGFVYKAIIG